MIALALLLIVLGVIKLYLVPKMEPEVTVNNYNLPPNSIRASVTIDSLISILGGIALLSI